MLPESHPPPARSIPAPPHGYPPRVDAAPLKISACRRLCHWSATADARAGEQVFRCGGCGSEWVASEPWTPIDHTGVVPEQVQAVRRRGRG